MNNKCCSLMKGQREWQADFFSPSPSRAAEVYQKLLRAQDETGRSE